MKKALALLLTMALSSISAVTVFASEVQPKNQRNEMSREEAVEWSLREYNVSRVVTDTPDPSEGVYNENDLIATTKVNMCIYGLIDYSCGETIMHDEPVVYSSNHTHTIDLIEGGAGDWGSGYSTFLYVIDDVQVHKSTSPMWFNIH